MNIKKIFKVRCHIRTTTLGELVKTKLSNRTPNNRLGRVKQPLFHLNKSGKQAPQEENVRIVEPNKTAIATKREH